jgi:hypothetical protein
VRRPEQLDEYLFERVGRRNAHRRRMHLLLDILSEKHIALFFYAFSAFTFASAAAMCFTVRCGRRETLFEKHRIQSRCRIV